MTTGFTWAGYWSCRIMRPGSSLLALPLRVLRPGPGEGQADVTRAPAPGRGAAAPPSFSPAPTTVERTVPPTAPTTVANRILLAPATTAAGTGQALAPKELVRTTVGPSRRAGEGR